MRQIPNSVRVFVCGMSGSGKTEFVARTFLPREQRLLIVDQTGEWFEREPHAPYVYGFDDLVKALRDVAGKSRWKIIASLNQEETEALASKILVPVPNPRKGFAAAVGGMGLLLDEVDVLAPYGRAPAALTHLWRRGRHVGLSVFGVTQRPANVSKEVTGMCRYFVTLQISEVNDVTYLRQRMGREVVERALRIVNHRKWHAFMFDVDRGIGYIVNPAGVVVGKLSAPAIHAPQGELL